MTCPECVWDFGFGFNDVKFSDRTFLLEIRHDSASNGQEADDSTENSFGAECSSTETKIIHINSIILAAKSLFFYKLFSNGMVESYQKQIKLDIQESEEESAFMDLLEFMYTNKLSSTTPSALVDVLIVADKYGVESCIDYCFQLLKKMPVTCESELVFLDFPSTVLMDDRAQALTNRAKEFLVSHFNDLSEFEEEMLYLPLAAIEVVLSSDYIQVNYEDEMLDFVLKWARRHYTEENIRRKMLTERLLCLIPFPFMSRSKLEKFLTCSDISLEHRSKLVSDALSFDTQYGQLSLISHKKERVYKLRPVKVRLNSPYEECVVYLDLKREECSRLLPNDRIYSHDFHFGGKVFYLFGNHDVEDKHNCSAHSFGLFLGIRETETRVVEFEFSTRKKPSGEFIAETTLEYSFTKETAFGYSNLVGESWDSFVAKNSRYFINGVLHLRVVIKFK